MVINGVADGGHRPFPSAVRSYSGAVGPGFLLLKVWWGIIITRVGTSETQVCESDNLRGKSARIFQIDNIGASSKRALVLLTCTSPHPPAHLCKAFSCTLMSLCCLLLQFVFNCVCQTWSWRMWQNCKYSSYIFTLTTPFLGFTADYIYKQMCCSEITPEGRRITKLDQILLNGNNITMVNKQTNKQTPDCVP